MEDDVSICKQLVISSKDRFLKSLSFVPDDKLGWSPSSTARTPLSIAAHVGVIAPLIANSITGGKPPEGVALPQVMAMIHGEEAKIATRDQAIAAIEAGATTTLAALDALTPELLASNAWTPFGPMPMGHFMFYSSGHIDHHYAQIEYLQTCWGDLEWH